MNKIEIPEENELTYKHLVKADALRIRNHFWDSIEEYLKVIKIDNSSIEAYKGLGLAYKQVGCVKNAINSFNNAKRLNPFDKNMYYEAGCCHCMDRNFSKAINEFKKAIKLCPQYFEAKHKLALVYELDGQYDLAVKEYIDIIDNNPLFFQSYNSLGSLYMKLNCYNDSAKVFKDLLRVNSDYIRAYLGIAISFDKLGDKIIAIRYYKKYLKHRPNSENVPYILDRLYELQKEIPNIARKSHLMLVS